MKRLRHPAALTLWLLLAGLVALASAAPSVADDVASADSTATSPADTVREKKFIEELSTKEVKRFLDPTILISRFEYQFQANYLPNDVELYTNRLRPWFAINNSHAVWARLPYLSYSLPDGSGQSGVGDIELGWGFMLYENLKRRLTAVAGAVDVMFPTGDPAKRTGFDEYAMSVTTLIATNPTDLFPVNLLASYQQTLGGAAKIQAVNLTLQTFHILPRGFFLAFIPTLVIDLNADFEVFSFGLGVGRALNRRLSLRVAYVQHISGRETFNQGFSIGLDYLWGSDKSKR